MRGQIARRAAAVGVVLLVILIAIAVSACGGPDAGTIYAKEHQPANSQFMMFMVPISCGQNCTTSVPIMYWVEDDEDWVLKIKDKSGDTGDKYVSQSAFDAANIGDWFDAKAPGEDDIKKLKRKPR